MLNILYMRIFDSDQNLARQKKEPLEYEKKTGAKEVKILSEEITGLAPLKERKLFPWKGSGA